jgi:hypothetical protein
MRWPPGGCFRSWILFTALWIIGIGGVVAPWAYDPIWRADPTKPDPWKDFDLKPPPGYRLDAPQDWMAHQRTDTKYSNGPSTIPMSATTGLYALLGS